MKTIKFINKKNSLVLGLILLLTVGCERELSDDVVSATFSNTAEIFTDNFVGLGSNFYFPYSDGFAKLDIFEVDSEVSYVGSSSLRIDVPNEIGDPGGSYAGAFFRIDGAGRDLTEYNALTFWVKSTGAPFIQSFGFGQSEVQDFQTSISNFQLSTTWTKVTIPIPDASRLTEEKGMFWLVALPDNGAGYSFWIDELKFENLGGLGQLRPFISNGQDVTGIGFEGETLSIAGVGVTANLANGQDVSVVSCPNFFTFTSSNPSVAATNVSEVSLVGGGTATITAQLGNTDAAGSLTVSSTALAQTPPARDAADVISVFSDAYTNVPVNHFNGYWGGSTTQGQDDININGNNIIKFTAINYVGTEFLGANTIDASQMTHFHMDILIETPLQPGDFLRIGLQDLGADNAFGGAPDRFGAITLRSNTTPALINGGWVSLDVPFSSFPGLSTRANLAQIVYVTDGTVGFLPGSITSVFIDNIYFYR